MTSTSESHVQYIIVRFEFPADATSDVDACAKSTTAIRAIHQRIWILNALAQRFFRLLHRDGSIRESFLFLRIICNSSRLLVINFCTFTNEMELRVECRTFWKVDVNDWNFKSFRTNVRAALLLLLFFFKWEATSPMRSYTYSFV